MAELFAGAAKVDITPPVGVDLCGFGHREGPSQAVHDALCAAALYLEADQSALLMTCDLIGLDRSTVAEVRAGLARTIGVPPSHIMIGCSHTHSGPATPCIRSLGKVDPAYLVQLKQKLIGVGQMAFARRQPAVLGTAREPVSIGINRRQRRPDGTMIIGQNEGGLTAPWTDVLAVDTRKEAPLARFFVHAAHAVTLSGLEISADWPGYAQRFVERIYGEGCVALFGQGCCGNINSHPRGTFEIAEAQGRAIAGAVVKAAEYADKQGDVHLACCETEIALPCFDPPSVPEAAAQLAAIREEAAQRRERNYGLEMMDAGNIAWAKRILDLARRGARQLTRLCAIQALRLNDFLLVALPGEVFVEYALQIEAASPYAHTAVIAYANDNIGYVPTAAAYAEGGYEVWHAIRFYGDTMLRPECESLILQTAYKAARALL